MTKPVSQTIRVHNRLHRPLTNQPVSYGVPWPQGAVRGADELVLTDEAGHERPFGCRVLNTWPDGSVQWSLVDCQLDLAPSATIGVRLAAGRAASHPPAHPVTASADARGGRLSNGLVDLAWINDPDGFRIISGDQREAGQPLINLTWCYGFDRDQRYLDACQKIVRDYLQANTAKYGRMLDEKPVGMLVKLVRYGDYASFEGMYWLWEITRDEELKQFLLSQLEWRLTLPYVNAFGAHRSGADFHPAAYGYLLTGDRRWLDRVAQPFRAAFRAGAWNLDFSHAMYFIKPAFELGIITDDDVTV